MTVTLERPPAANINAGKWRVEILDTSTPQARASETWVGNGVRFDWMGEAWAYGLDLILRWTGAGRFRVMRDGDDEPWADSDCKGCYEQAKGGMYPTHHVSSGCDHQQQPHCTGDGCF